MSNRTYYGILNVFKDFGGKMTARMIWSRYKESNDRVVLMRTISANLSRAVKDGVIKRDENGLYYVDNII